MRITFMLLVDLPVKTGAILGAPRSVDATVLRLMEMGMTRGTRVTVTRRAPLGGPIEILVRGTRVCLRKSDAARFAVDVEDA